MRDAALWFAAAAALVLSPAAAAPARPARPAVAKDWSATVSRTAAGAYVMGNPQARVRLVEYMSMTCSHCAAFAQEAWSTLRAKYIGPGLVSLEVRHAVRDRADMAASLLARCTGPRGYFASTEFLFSRQRDWLERAAAAAPPASEDVSTPQARAAALAVTAKAAGLDRLMAGRGLSPAREIVCLGDVAEQDVLGAMTTQAWSQIEGTPAFLINGTAVSGNTWTMLEPQLAAAVR